jgi:hypothetical protein
MVKPMALAQPSAGVLHRGGHGGARVVGGQQGVGVVELQDEGDLARELGRAGSRKPLGRRVGVAARLEGQFEVIAGVVARGFGAKERAGPCSKPWSTGRMTNLPVPARRPVFIMRARFVEHADVLGAVPAQDFLHAIGQHGDFASSRTARYHGPDPRSTGKP